MCPRTDFNALEKIKMIEPSENQTMSTPQRSRCPGYRSIATALSQADTRT